MTRPATSAGFAFGDPHVADDAGALLVRSGLIADDQLHEARRAQADAGGTVAEHLVLGGAVDDDELTRFFRSRLMVPQVNPNDLASIAPRIIAKVPADMAAEFRAVPVHLDRDGNLTVAMADPSNSHAVDEIAFFTGHYVVRAVATQRQLAWCLAHYYGFVTPLGETLLQPELSPADGVPRPVRSHSVTDQVKRMRHDVHAPVAGDDPDDADTTEDEPTPPGVQPALVIVAEEPTPPTGPQRPGHRPPTQPPELAARSGEMVVRGGRDDDPDSGLPAVVVEEAKGTDTSPILLDRARRPGEEPPTLEVLEDPDNTSEVVLLSRPKGAADRRRSPKATRLGLGFEMPRRRRDDPPADGVPQAELDEADTGAVEKDPTGRFEKLDAGYLTGDELDDGWGPPGTTIPPPYLGAMPGTDVDDFDLGQKKAAIPIVTDEDFDDLTDPHEIEPPESPIAEVPDDTVRTTPAPPAGPASSAPSGPVMDPAVAAELTEASMRLVEVVRDLDHADTRDRVIDRLMEHLGESHARVAFYVLRQGALELWRRSGERPGTGDGSLSLDRPSSLQDVVRTRLPYRGPSTDPTTRQFVTETLGAPDGDLLMVPVDVRGRVVGVLYADGAKKRIFEEHMSVMSRAAGMALERILKDRKS